MMQQLQRPITSGSRQAPDPYDQFLESRCLYRKHTARDASSLFRVIAEQMYDTQMLNYEVRLECVRFMTQKRRIFEQDVSGDFDSYMLEMSKPKAYGSMLELRAMCCMYRRNVILYEPFNMGTVVTFNRHYNDYFRVFYTNENHYDSVYQLDYVQMGAICQSITYKLLYKMLFKLPDVSYAVERMLHPHTLEWGACDVELDNRGYMLRIRCYDGRLFHLDLPEHTKCILENYKLCNFHNSSQMMRRCSSGTSIMKLEICNNNNLQLIGQIESSEMVQMCPNREVSCVRQLLDDGITPFPYKVAKSLDPFMYRNVEFDCWNDLRKEAKRYNSYGGDYDFKVGAKCRVEMEHDSELYTCHIQNISQDKSFCVVYVEKFGKKIVVPYESVHPLPPEEFRPWTLPYRCQRQMQRMQLSKCVNKLNKLQKWKKNKMFDMGSYFEATKRDIVQMHQYIQLDHCFHSMTNQSHNQQPQQQLEDGVGDLQQQHITEPEPEREPSQQLNTMPSHQQLQSRHSVIATCAPVQESVASVIPVPTIHTHAHFMNYLPIQPGASGVSPDGQAPPPWGSSPLAMHEEFQYPIVAPPPTGAPVTSEGNCLYMPFGGAYRPPPPTMSLPSQPLARPFMPPFAHSLLPPPTTGTQSSEPRRSLHLNGEDLPADVGTLRYFYNMGVDMHFRMSHQQTPPEDISAINYNNNTDQPQQQIISNEETGNQVPPATLATTPPPSPDAITTNGAPVDTSPVPPAAADRTNHRSKHRNNGTNSHNKSRGKRPEQLQDLKDNHQLAHTVAGFLPTPTPSPSTNGNQFNFYGSPPGPPMMAAAYITPHLMRAPPPPIPPGPAPVPFFFHKPGGPPLPAGANGQTHYGWGIAAPPPPPPTGGNMIGVPPYEGINNLPMDANNIANGQATTQATAVVTAGTAQVPAVYGAPRQH